jgi:hypothetical protein
VEFGSCHEFLSAGAGSRTEAFAQIEAAERWGWTSVWLAEIRMNPTRSLLSAPLTVASAIAARTQRIRIGTAVQILPLSLSSVCCVVQIGGVGLYRWLATTLGLTLASRLRISSRSGRP